MKWCWGLTRRTDAVCEGVQLRLRQVDVKPKWFVDEREQCAVH